MTRKIIPYPDTRALYFAVKPVRFFSRESPNALVYDPVQFFQDLERNKDITAVFFKDRTAHPDSIHMPFISMRTPYQATEFLENNYNARYMLEDFSQKPTNPIER